VEQNPSTGLRKRVSMQLGLRRSAQKTLTIARFGVDEIQTTTPAAARASPTPAGAQNRRRQVPCMCTPATEPSPAMAAPCSLARSGSARSAMAASR